MKVAVISHFDRHAIVDDYFLYSLRCYRPYFDFIVVVSTSPLSVSEQSRLSIYADKIIVRDNIGYDFVSWRVGFETLPLRAVDEVSFINDSIYGPCRNIGSFFEIARSLPCDCWGASINKQFRPHVQSYFMTFKRRLIESGFAQAFWSTVEPQETKLDIIEKYEIGLSARLEGQGFTIGGVVDMANLDRPTRRAALDDNFPVEGDISEDYRDFFLHDQTPNPVQLFWGHCFRAGSPFLKVELLRSNPLGANVSEIFALLKRNRWYDYRMIVRHLERILPADEFSKICNLV